MESPPSTTTTPTMLRRRAHTSWSTAAAANGHGNAVLVSPEQSPSLRRCRLPTASTNAAVGSDAAAAAAAADDDDDFHLSSCSSSSLGGSSSVSGSSDFRRDALQQLLHHRSRPQLQLQLHAEQLQQPHLHRRYTYAGGPIDAATAETPRQQRQRRIAIEIPLAMKEVVIRHSRSRLVREDAMNDTDGNGDSDDIDDESSTLSSLEVDLGHGRGIGGASEQQNDPRRRYWTDRRREASNNTSSSSTNRVYSSTNALCGAEVDGDVTNLDDAHVDDDDEPSHMSYSLSTSSLCKSSMMRNRNNRRPPGHFKNQQSRDSSFLGGLGFLDIGAAAPMTAGDGTKSAATVYSAEGGRRSASPSHRSRDFLFRAVVQDQQSFRRAAPQAQLSTSMHDVDEKQLLNQHPPKCSNRSHRRHSSESCLLHTSIGTDTDTTADSSRCLSHHHNIHNNNIGSTFGTPPPPQSPLLPQFSGGSGGSSSSSDGIFGHGSRSGAKRTHRRCASAGCGVHVVVS